MKKAFSLILLFSAVFALTNNPAKASPVKEDHSSISATVLSDMATPVVLKYEPIGEYFVTAITPASDIVAAQPTTVQLPEKVILNKDPLVLDERLWLYRHYFNHEDNKEYPEYRSENLSAGFTTEVFHPAR